jgi:hypothetical protein
VVFVFEKDNGFDMDISLLPHFSLDLARNKRKASNSQAPPVTLHSSIPSFKFAKMTSKAQSAVIEYGSLSAAAVTQVDTICRCFKTGEYSDVTVCCGQHEFKVHKNVICPQSE